MRRLQQFVEKSALIALILGLPLLIGVVVLEDSSRNRDAGRQAGLEGIPVEACPYVGSFSQLSRESWIKGWQEGFIARRRSHP